MPSRPSSERAAASRYDWQWNDGRKIAKGKPRWPDWLVDRLGPDYFADVTRVDLGWGPGGRMRYSHTSDTLAASSL